MGGRCRAGPAAGVAAALGQEGVGAATSASTSGVPVQPTLLTGGTALAVAAAAAGGAAGVGAGSAEKAAEMGVAGGGAAAGVETARVRGRRAGGDGSAADGVAQPSKKWEGPLASVEGGSSGRSGAGSEGVADGAAGGGDGGGGCICSRSGVGSDGQRDTEEAGVAAGRTGPADIVGGTGGRVPTAAPVLGSAGVAVASTRRGRATGLMSASAAARAPESPPHAGVAHGVIEAPVVAGVGARPAAAQGLSVATILARSAFAIWPPRGMAWELQGPPMSVTLPVHDSEVATAAAALVCAAASGVADALAATAAEAVPSSVWVKSSSQASASAEISAIAASRPSSPLASLLKLSACCLVPAPAPAPLLEVASADSCTCGRGPATGQRGIAGVAYDGDSSTDVVSAGAGVVRTSATSVGSRVRSSGVAIGSVGHPLEAGAAAAGQASAGGIVHPNEDGPAGSSSGGGGGAGAPVVGGGPGRAGAASGAAGLGGVAPMSCKGELPGVERVNCPLSSSVGVSASGGAAVVGVSVVAMLTSPAASEAIERAPGVAARASTSSVELGAAASEAPAPMVAVTPPGRGMGVREE